MSTIESLNTFKQLGGVRVVANSLQAGTYFNGPTNNGVGATFTYTATGALVIDGVTLNLNEFVLFAGQVGSAYQNGIYQVINTGGSGISAVLQRRGDLQCIEQLRAGHYVPVAAGNQFAGTMWTVIEPLPAAIGNPAVAGANDINFVETGSNAGGVGPYSASVTLNQSQIQNAYATPVQLIPAPGAGKTIMVLNCSIYTNFQTAAFANGGVGVVQYDSTVHGAGTNALSATIPAAEITAAASQVYALNENTGNALTGITNKAIYFSNQTGAFTAGNAASTVTFNLTYQIINATV